MPVLVILALLTLVVLELYGPQNQFARPHLTLSDSVGLQWGLRICISNK